MLNNQIVIEMRTLMLSVIFVIGSVSIVAAQTLIGLKVGTSATSLRTAYRNLDSGAKPNDASTARLGYVIGGFASFDIGKHFLFRPELQLRSKGSDLAQGLYTAHFYSATLLAGYRLNDRLSLLAGPEFGGEFEGEFLQEGQEVSRSKFADVEFNFGLDYQWKKGLGVGMRYTHGISKYLNRVEPFVDAWYKNQSIQAYISYSFKS